MQWLDSDLICTSAAPGHRLSLCDWFSRVNWLRERERERCMQQASRWQRLRTCTGVHTHGREEKGGEDSLCAVVFFWCQLLVEESCSRVQSSNLSASRSKFFWQTTSKMFKRDEETKQWWVSPSQMAWWSSVYISDSAFTLTKTKLPANMSWYNNVVHDPETFQTQLNHWYHLFYPIWIQIKSTY